MGGTKGRRIIPFDQSPLVKLVEAGFAPKVVTSLKTFPEHEALQITGCELLGLLASGYWGMEQKVFDAGGVQCCLAAIDAWQEKRLLSEEVLGAAFNGVHNICSAEEISDKRGCARKQAAVEWNALEVINAAMTGCHERWVQQAGKLAIGCLCKGSDKQGQERRKRAHALFKVR